MFNRCAKCGEFTESILCVKCRVDERGLARGLPNFMGPTGLTLDR